MDRNARAARAIARLIGSHARLGDRPLAWGRWATRSEPQLEEEDAIDRVVVVALDPAEAEGEVERPRGVHRRQRIEPHRRVAKLTRPADRRLHQRAPGARAARKRPDAEPFDLAGALLERPQRDAAGDLLAVARDEDRVVAVGQRGELALGVDEPTVLPEPAEVLAEELAERVGVSRARVGDQRSARSASTSAAPGSQAPAATFARTCSGLVAPAITQLTAGIASRPPTATSSSGIPRSSA